MFALLLVSLFASFSQATDFSGVPSARTVEESRALFAVRAQRALSNEADTDFSLVPAQGVGFHTVSNAKLALRQDVAEVNLKILDPATKVYARVGSNFQDVGFLCRRTGDYDFQLFGLVTMIYRFGDDPTLIWPETRKKLLHTLLSARGNQPHLKNNFWLCGIHDETENHILMTEGSRYLTNQLLQDELRAQGKYDPLYDNDVNGMTEFLLRFLQGFARDEFSEYNAKPYSAYTVMGIHNIQEFSRNPRVKIAARNLLDYLGAKFAASSRELVRVTPFRRQPQYRHHDETITEDPESKRMALMAGDLRRLRYLEPPGVLSAGGYLILPALGEYRLPGLVLDHLLNPGQGHFQWFHHRAIEIYSASRSWLLSAGGIYENVFDMGSKQMDAWAVPTTLIPGGSDAVLRSQLIRFEGDKDDAKRVNTCVVPGFACGLAPVVPEHAAGEWSRQVSGAWTFVDFETFVAAVYSRKCDTRACRKGAARFGFLEAVEKRPGFGLSEISARVLARNGGRSFHSAEPNIYVTVHGQAIEFTPMTGDKWKWPIAAMGERRYERDLRKWPRAGGDLIRADGRGRIEILNPALRQRLVLDHSDPLQPRRTLETF